MEQTRPHDPQGDRSPFDDAELYEALFHDFRFDLDSYLELAKNAGGPVLEIGCGTGRVLLPCLQAGVDIDGLDQSPPMLEVLQKKASGLGLAPRAYNADMRCFSLPRRYRLIIIPFNGFLHNLTTEDQLETLRTSRAHLLPGGTLVFNIFYPSLEILSGAEGIPVLEQESVHPSTGRTIRLYDTRTFDRVNQTQQSRIEIQELDAAGEIVASHKSEVAVRWIFKPELELLLRTAGFQHWRICGGFDRRPHLIETQEMVVFAEKV